MSTNALISSMYHDLVTGKVYPLLTHIASGQVGMLHEEADEKHVENFKIRYRSEVGVLKKEQANDAVLIFLERVVLAKNIKLDKPYR